MEYSIELGVIIILSFLTVATLSSILLQKINFPYTIGLVVIGALWAFLANNLTILETVRGISLSPEIILYLILPTLIFDAAININIWILYKNVVPILLLAIVGIIISTMVIGVLLPLCTPLALSGALLFGALISATDPVAVIALFNEIKAPRRLLTLIDGESIFNDATAIVLFTVISSTQIVQYSDLIHNFLPGLMSFAIVLSGGIIVGALVGVIGVLMLLIKKGDMILQLTVSLIMAYASFIIADKLGVSGVISTLTAGIVLGGTTEHTIKRRHVETLHHFWEYFVFITNSFVFLLLGFTEFSIFNTQNSIKHSIGIILISIPIIIIARACVIYILVPLYNKFVRQKENRISKAYQAILLWGGLRGAVPVALVLTIPESVPHRAILLHLTFGFILFTLLIQGTTIKKLMTLLNITPEDSELEGDDIITFECPFENEHLTSLVATRLFKIFSQEGFFLTKAESDNSISYTIKKRGIIIATEQKEQSITFRHRPADSEYVHTILYETLLEFTSSIDAIKKAIKPEHLSLLAHNHPATEIPHKNNKTKTIDLLKILSVDNIITDIAASSKNDAIKELLQLLQNNNQIIDYESALQAILKREENMSTGIGKNIALPHAKISGIKNIIAAIGIKKDGLDFDSIDEQPVHIIVLILSPANAPVPHIQFLAAISKVLSDNAIKEKIINAQSPAGLLECIKEKTNNID